MTMSRACRILLAFGCMVGCGAGSATSSDAGQGHDGAAGGASDAGAGGAPVVVAIQNIAMPGTGNRYSAVKAATNEIPAVLLDEVTLCQDPAAEVTSIAGCDVLRCSFEGPDIVGFADAGLLPTLVDLGPITVSSESTVATLVWSGYYEWVDNPTTTPLPSGFTWHPGAQVRVSGGGERGLAAFDATLEFPPALTGTGLMAAPGTQTISQARSADVTWSADTVASGTVTIEILGEQAVPPLTSTTYQAAICRAPVAAGSFRLPPALLAAFKAGPTALLVASTDVRKSVAAGTRSVSLAARSIVVQGVIFQP